MNGFGYIYVVPRLAKHRTLCKASQLLRETGRDDILQSARAVLPFQPEAGAGRLGDFVIILNSMFLEEGTFGIFPAWICQGRNPIQQAIISWLWFHKNKEGICFPSQSLLAEECGISVSSANAHLSILEKEGIIVREVRFKEGTKQKYSTLYKLPMHSVKNSTYSTTCSTGTPPNGVGTPPNGEELYPDNQTQLEPNPRTNNARFKKAFEELIEREPESATAKTAFYFMKLGWKPKESVEDLREWIVELAESRKVNAEELKHAVKEWYLYWSAHPEKPVKNHKNSLGNTPLLNKDKWKKN